MSNETLRDEIRDYWSDRAESFDAQPGHGIASETERAAWLALLRRHLPQGCGSSALDLACGSGEMGTLLLDLGYRVTGLDWSEPMLAIARRKAAAADRAVAFRQADAEVTMEPDAAYDLLLTRHLVWTLVDPAAAFAEWHRILRPGGRLVIIDGDFVRRTVTARLLDWAAARLGLRRRPAPDPELAARHRAILDRVHFRDGARAEAVAAMLRAAGFENIRVDFRLAPVNRAIARHAGLIEGLRREVQHRYLISAERAGPAGGKEDPRQQHADQHPDGEVVGPDHRHHRRQHDDRR